MTADRFQQTKLYRSIMPQPMIQRIKTKFMPHWNNVKYLTRHKWFVFRAGLKLNVPLWRLVIHDWSKLTPIEWFAYTNYFFSNPGESGKAYVPGRKPGVAHQPMTTVEGVLASADEPNLNDDVFPKEVLDKAVEKFNGSKQLIAEQFDRAWLHHIHHNPHHHQHWVLQNDNGEVKCLEMPKHFALEMCADWCGAGKAQGKTEKDAVLTWYNENKENIKLHPKTKKFVETTLDYYVHCRS